MQFVVLSLCALFVSVAYSQYSSCAVFDTGNFRLYDVTSTTFNDTDTLGKVSGNMCVDQERSCSYTTDLPCSFCQFVAADTVNEHSYCMGYNDKNKVYSNLPDKYSGTTGFRVTLQGDSIYCPNNVQRTTVVDVLCDQLQTTMAFQNEAPTCQYNWILYQKGNCRVSENSFTPAFTITSLTPNSIEVYITDQFPFMFWTYTIILNDKLAYSGLDRRVKIDNLDAGTTYFVKVQTLAGPGAAAQYNPTSPPAKVVTLPTNVGSFHTPVISGTGAGIAYGIIIALAILAALVGGYKFYKSDFFHEKFGVGGGGSKSSKGFSLMDAEKSNAFE